MKTTAAFPVIGESFYFRPGLGVKVKVKHKKMKEYCVLDKPCLITSNGFLVMSNAVWPIDIFDRDLPFIHKDKYRGAWYYYDASKGVCRSFVGRLIGLPTQSIYMIETEIKKMSRMPVELLEKEFLADQIDSFLN